MGSYSVEVPITVSWVEGRPTFLTGWQYETETSGKSHERKTFIFFQISLLRFSSRFSVTSGQKPRKEAPRNNKTRKHHLWLKLWIALWKSQPQSHKLSYGSLIFAGTAVVDHQKESSDGVFCPFPLVSTWHCPFQEGQAVRRRGSERDWVVILLISVCVCTHARVSSPLSLSLRETQQLVHALTGALMKNQCLPNGDIKKATTTLNQQQQIKKQQQQQCWS